MYLSTETVSILKNFSTINQSILIKAGKKLRTMSVMKNILSEVDIDEEVNLDAEAAVVDDEDDLEIADQLDDIEPTAEINSSEDEPEIVSENSETLDEAPELASNDNAADVNEELGKPASSSDADWGPPPPMGPGKMQEQAEMQRRAAAGAVAGGSALGGFASLFKSRGNGLGKKPQLNSKPKRMSLAERAANKDPKKAANYYKTASDDIIREKLYRDNYLGINEGMVNAEEAKSRYISGVKDFNEKVASVAGGTELAKLAEANDTSIGDYINAVTSGTVKDAAAQSIIKDLGQNSEVKTAQDNLFKASGDFKESVKGINKKAETLATNFPGRADMDLRASQLKQMAEEIGEQSPTKINEKIKKLKKEMDEFIKGILESLKNVAQAVASSIPGVKAPAA